MELRRLRRFSRRFQRWYFEKRNIREREVMIDEWNGDVEYICHVYTILIQNLVEPSSGYKSLSGLRVAKYERIIYAESNGCILVSNKCIKQKI